MLALALGLHAVAAVAAPATSRWLGRHVFLLAGLAPAATSAWLLAEASGVVDGRAVTAGTAWAADIGLRADLRLDGFSLLMCGLISGVGVLVFLYSRWYFADRPGLGRFAGILVAFSGSMLGVVLADNLLLLYVFWELTSVTSYLLIGFEDTKGSARSAALQAILVTGAGGLAMLAGFVVIGQAAGTYSLSAILADPPGGTAVGAGLVLVLLGALTKSAQVPFHTWLPGAMAAPTPVSAYLHSATMVKAGVYLVARFAPAFAGDQAVWRPLVVTVGAATMLVGGYRALRQHDLKLLLAFGTVSQLGFMVVLVGAGYPSLTFAGAALILAHGVFKAALFMTVGVIDHQAHTRDLRELSGLHRRMRPLFVAATVATVSMAGLPPLAGFLAKEAAFEALLHDGGPVLVGAVVAGSVLTFAYGARFLWGAFATKPDSGPYMVGPSVPRPATPFVAPVLFLAGLTVALGLVPGATGTIAAAAARSLDPATEKPKLYLWHGFTAALGLSALTVVAGLLLFLLRGEVERVQRWLAPRLGAQPGYEALLEGLRRTADKVTGIVQNGSLPIYVGVILLTVLALPGSVLLTRTRLPDDGLRVAESPLQLAILVGMAVAAVATARARRRFVAVLLLGAVGFAVAVLFVLQGAPDLALTQLLVETLALVIFVLVLRHLPERFEPTRWMAGKVLRLVVAVGVGAFVSAFGLVAAGSRTADPVSDAQLELALPQGGGRNVVNVILTDIRALDTLGEITVLAVAALGIAALVLAGHPERSRRSRRGGERR